MKKIIPILALVLSVNAFAAANDAKKADAPAPAEAKSSAAAIGLSVVPPLQYPNMSTGVVEGFRFGLLGSHNDTVRGADWNLLYGGTHTSFQGAQFSGLLNLNLGETEVVFLQFGGLANFTGGKNTVHGFQLAGLMNYAGGTSEINGVQASLVGIAAGDQDVMGAQYNYLATYNGGASAVQGLQGSGLATVTAGSERVSGIQGSGLLNLSMKGQQLRGIQSAGLANLVFQSDDEAKEVESRGARVAGLVNLNLMKKHLFRGLDGAGVATVSPQTRVEGLQASGLYNHVHSLGGLQASTANVVSTRMQGVQVGVVNYADEVEGLQLGVVNYAGTLRGVQLGLVNIAANNGLIPVMVALNFGV